MDAGEVVRHAECGIEGQDRDGRAVKPDFIVDITATFETKRRMLACHDSQRQWLRRMHGLDDYMDSMEKWSRQRGREGGVGLLPMDHLVGRADAVVGSWDLGIRSQPIWTWMSGFRVARFFTAVH